MVDEITLNALLVIGFAAAMPVYALLYGEWEPSARRRLFVAATNLLVAALATYALVALSRTKFTFAIAPCLLFGASYYFASLFLPRARFALLAALLVIGGLVARQNAELRARHPGTFELQRLQWTDPLERELLFTRIRASLAGRATTDETVLPAGDVLAAPELRPVFASAIEDLSDRGGYTGPLSRVEFIPLWHTPITGLCREESRPQILRYPGGKLREGLGGLALEPAP